MCFGRSLKGEHPNDLTSEPIRAVGAGKTSTGPTTLSKAPLPDKHSNDGSSIAATSTTSRPKQGYNSFLGGDPGALRGKDFVAMGGVPVF